MTNERGSMLPMTAGLFFVALAITALVVEISLLGIAYRDVATVADLAAESGAAVISAPGIYESGLSLDSDAARIEALRVGGLWGSVDQVLTVDVGPERICVTVADVYRPRTLAFIGVAEITVEVTGCAEPAAG